MNMHLHKHYSIETSEGISKYPRVNGPIASAGNWRRIEGLRMTDGTENASRARVSI